MFFLLKSPVFINIKLTKTNNSAKNQTIEFQTGIKVNKNLLKPFTAFQKR